MELFELFATLGLDTSKFTSGLTGALKWALGQVWDFAKDVVETGMGFDEQMSAVQAVLGSIEGTEEHMAELRRVGLLEARDSIFTSEEVAKAYYYMGMAGWETEEMLKGLPAILDLAAASGEPLARVSDIVTDSLTAFGYSADEAQHFVDILAQTATNSNTDVRRMGETFKYVAPIAGALGYSVDDVALSIGLLASAGIKGSMAGTTLRNIFTRISTNAGETTKDLGALTIITEKLGVDFFDAEGNARDWGDVLMELREAWTGLDDDFLKKGILSEFGNLVGEGADVNETLQTFLEDEQEISDLTKQLAGTTGKEYESMSAQIIQFGQQYDELLKLMGIPIPNTAEGYADALEKARLALGELSDADKIYYAKQIASMRGMSGFLALLESTDENVKQLVNSYANAKDAAEAMAGVRLDNLAGDVKLFNASLDVLKIALFDDVKGPMREVVQFATVSLQRITDAVNNAEPGEGLVAGIKQLGVEIEGFADKWSPALASLGAALAPVIESLIDTLLKSGGAIIELGVSLGEGLWQGISLSIIENAPTLAKLLGLEVVPEIARQAAEEAEKGAAATIWDSTVANLFRNPTLGGIERTNYHENADRHFLGSESEPIEIPVVPTIDPVDLLGAIRESIDSGEPVDIGDGLSITPESGLEMLQGMAEAGDELAAFIAANLESEISGAGIGDELASDLGSAGDPAGDQIAASIQGKLSSTRFSINVTANVTGFSGLGGVKITPNARAMNTGYIFNKPTVFGYAEGAFQMAGDAGPEAVVGVNSLNNMIQNSVNNAVASVLGKLDRIINNQGKPVPAVVDAGSLSDGLAPYMDRSLGTRYEYSGRRNA